MPSGTTFQPPCVSSGRTGWKALLTAQVRRVAEALTSDVKIDERPFGGTSFDQLGTPLAQAISQLLVYDGDITSLFAFQFGLSLVAVGAVNILPLPQGIKVRAFGVLDLISFPLLAIGVGLLCAFLVQGRIVWWPTPWLGGALAAGILGAYAGFHVLGLVEYNFGDHEVMVIVWFLVGLAAALPAMPGEEGAGA